MATRTIDTNVLIRLLVDDHSEQVTIASRLAAQFRLVVLPTVLLETEWVLRSRFGLPRQSIVELFERIIDFDGFIVVEKERVGRAFTDSPVAWISLMRFMPLSWQTATFS